MFGRKVLTKDEAQEHLERMPKLLKAYDKHAETKRALEAISEKYGNDVADLKELGGSTTGG